MAQRHTTPSVPAQQSQVRPGVREKASGSVETQDSYRTIVDLGPGRGLQIAVHFPKEKLLTAVMFAATPLHEQKETLAALLFLLIQKLFPDSTGKIIGMLVKLDNLELLHMLEDNEYLKIKVEEATALLQADQTKQKASQIMQEVPEEAVPVQQAMHMPEQKPLTTKMLTAALLQGEEQDQDKRQLLSFVHHMLYPMAVEAMIVLLQSDNSELLQMLVDNECLKAYVVGALTAFPPDWVKQLASTHIPMNIPQGLGVSQTVPVQEALLIPKQEPLTATMLAAIPPHMQIIVLGERLLPLIQRTIYDYTSMAIGIPPKIDNSQILHMLQNFKTLKRYMEGSYTPFFVIQRMYPSLARKITCVLLLFDNSELMEILEDNLYLTAYLQTVAAILVKAKLESSI